VSGDGKRADLTYPARYPPGGWYLPTGGIGGFHDGFLDPRDGGKRTHYATDIMAPHGSTLFATVSGTISRLPNKGIGGRGVILRGDDGIRYYYAHLSGWTGPSGGRVGAGTAIGFVGSTGNASGPHLHFSMKLLSTGRYINPYPYLKAGGSAPDAGAYGAVPTDSDNSVYAAGFDYQQPQLRTRNPTDMAANAFGPVDSTLNVRPFNARDMLGQVFSVFGNALAGEGGRVDYRTLGRTGVDPSTLELEEVAAAPEPEGGPDEGVKATVVDGEDV
jgi:hypothetical protein